MSGDRQVVRSYQRIFRPDRRIYQVEGHQIPIPGGIPLAWLAWFITALLSVLALSGQSLSLSVLLALCAGLVGRAIGGRHAALLFGVGILAGTQAVGLVLSVIDWPLRLLVVPATVATLVTQATPDGRPAHRYARSWLAVHLKPARRTLGQPLPAAGGRRLLASRLWVALDHHSPRLRHGRVIGPASVAFRRPVTVTNRRLRGPARQRATAAAPAVGVGDDVVLAQGAWLEVRP